MMALLAPAWLLGGALAALAVVALHLLAWRRPPASPLPTARFVPDLPARARARATRPTDVPLLLVRVAALLLASVALARPVWVSPRAPLARIVVADLSASAADAATVRSLAREAWLPGDALVAVDSAARRVSSADSLPARASRRPGALSPALVVADDAARELAASADSVELVVVSPMLREETDAATAGLARAWPGRVRHVAVPAPAAGDSSRAVTLEAPDDDAVAAGARLAGVRSAAEVRLVRRAATAADSAWVGAGAGRVLVAWPVRAARSDAAHAALAWAGEALVAPFAPFASEGAVGEGGTLVRWADGSAAATEHALGDGCVRDVRVAVPDAGDVTLSPAFGRLLGHLAAPCGGPRDLRAVSAAAIGLRTSGAARALPRPAPRDPWRIGRWLLAGAVVLLLLEPFLRRGRSLALAGDVRPPARRDGAAEAA